MNATRIIFVFGSFLTSFGAVLLISEVPQWAWWTGKGMVILGPLLTTSLVMGRKQDQPESITPQPEVRVIK